MHSVGFEPTTPGGQRPQTYALDRAVTVTATSNTYRDGCWTNSHTLTGTQKNIHEATHK